MIGPANLPFTLAGALGEVEADEIDEDEEEEEEVLDEYPKSWLDMVQYRRRRRGEA